MIKIIVESVEIQAGWFLLTWSYNLCSAHAVHLYKIISNNNPQTITPHLSFSQPPQTKKPKAQFLGYVLS